METEIIVEDVALEQPILITSFPGIGLVGTIATTHFIIELKLENIGVIESALIPPIATLFDGIVLPPIRIYKSKELNFILVHSDVPIPPQFSYDISKVIVDWAIKINARRLYSLAGVATFEDKKRVFGAATKKELLGEIDKYVEIFKSGTISGIAGCILNECVARKVPAIVLLGETAGFNPDPRAAANVVEAMNRIFNWKVSTERLIQEAEFIEAQMQMLADQARAHEIKKEELPMFG
ncbi:MAG: proteasome assembly chaperone family protein [Archaeoglobales archaeon]|nr:proteasome assembly chaperone family protein [Archaeoglobales archaeon]